jgi:hypothetical protein
VAFVQRLEEYHRGAAVAHREHSTVPLSMPAAPKPIWDSVGVAATPITPATPNGPTPNGPMPNGPMPNGPMPNGPNPDQLGS